MLQYLVRVDHIELIPLKFGLVYVVNAKLQIRCTSLPQSKIPFGLQPFGDIDAENRTAIARSIRQPNGYRPGPATEIEESHSWLDIRQQKRCRVFRCPSRMRR